MAVLPFATASVLAVSLLASEGPPAVQVHDSLSCAGLLPSQVRVLDCRLATTVAAALRSSATLRGEFERIGQLQGIVYVATSRAVGFSRKDLAGALSHQVGVSGAVCVLRVTLAYEYGDRVVGTLAHELHHAIEVLEHADARTESAIDALFKRIGDPVGYGEYETRAAITIQKTVLRELQDARR